MRFHDFIIDKISAILLNLCCGILLFVFLHLTGTGQGERILILVAWIMILFSWLYLTYGKQKRKLMELHRIIDTLDKKYLFIEMVGKPTSRIESEYYGIIRLALKSMTEHVSQTQREMTEYRNFIEQWVHEIKRPITTTELICENHKDEYTRKIRFQMEEIERHIERVLYYARLGYVEKDYIISEITLKNIVEDVLARNKLLFIQNDIQVNMQNLEYSVYSDKKWIVFILNQILINSVQYKREPSQITFYAVKEDNSVKLVVRDNGIGIKESEITRIFQLGFTGSNGRTTKNSTGIGLYLCHELCKNMGIDISVSSRINEYTEITLTFPVNTTVKIQKQC